MIHTFEVRYDLDRSSAKYCINRLNYIARTYSPLFGRVRHKSPQEVKEYLKGSRNSLFYYMENLFLGLHHIKFTKFRIDETSANYYIRFKIEPEVFITQNYQLNLFQCNENNFDALQRHWAEMIYCFFPCVFDHRPIEGCDDLLSPEERRHNQDIEDRYRYRLLINKEDRKHYIRRRLYNLPYLGLVSKVLRCDYTADFYCEYPEVYLKLAQQSYVDYDRKKRKRYLPKGKYLAAYNKDVDGIVIYDKQKKLMLDRYENKPNIEELRRSAANTIRIEYVFKCKSRKKQIKFTGLNLPPKRPGVPKPSLCGMMPYIIQDLGADRLREEYYKHIGGGQWVSDYYFKRAVTESGLTRSMRRKLMEAAYLISQARHMDTAEQQFVEGCIIQRSHGQDLFVGGLSAGTFRGYVNRIRNLGLQPLRIPETDNWKENGQTITHVSSEYDDFTLVDIGVAQHPVYDLVAPDGSRFPNYDSTIADLKDLYNRYRAR